mmetsp:Transcript_27993/g.75590  ORF Transcript_27993/g.75590 Transcript_27993/m.75590 type:complete len:231 (+) Transcript_27993:169-861(+)
MCCSPRQMVWRRCVRRWQSCSKAPQSTQSCGAPFKPAPQPPSPRHQAAASAPRACPSWAAAQQGVLWKGSCEGGLSTVACPVVWWRLAACHRLMVGLVQSKGDRRCNKEAWKQHSSSSSSSSLKETTAATSAAQPQARCRACHLPPPPSRLLPQTPPSPTSRAGPASQEPPLHLLVLPPQLPQPLARTSSPRATASPHLPPPLSLSSHSACLLWPPSSTRACRERAPLRG